MQAAGGIKNRKRRQQKLQDVITKSEEDVKITAIQTLDLEEFAAMVETIDKQTAPDILKRLQDSLDLHYKQINQLSLENKTKQFTDILAFRELIRNYRTLLRNDSLHEELKEQLIKEVRDYDKKVNKLIDQVISMRTNIKNIEWMEQQNFIGIAVLNIKNKILIYASPNDDTAINNLQRTLNSLVIGLKARIEDLERSDVIKIVKDNKIYLKGPSPAKFFNRIPGFKVDRTIAEHQINSILDLYSLLSSLKTTIHNMPNIKRTHINIRKDTEKYNKQSWETMIQKLNDVVTTAALDMAQIIIKNIPKLLKQNKTIGNIFADPYLEQPKHMLYVYDALEEINFAVMRSYSSVNANAIKLLVNSVYIKWMDGVLPVLTGKRAERLLLVRAVQGLFGLEDNLRVSFVMVKQKLAQHPITAQMVKGQHEYMKAIDNILSKKHPSTKTVDAVNNTLDDILRDISVKPKVEVKVEKAKHEKSDYDKFIRTLKYSDKYSTLQSQIIKYFYDKYGTKLDLSFYVNCTKEDYQTRLLLHLSGFFKMYANVYGFYGRDLFRDLTERSNSFHLWRMTRVDSGKLIGVYKNFLSVAIKRGFVLFRNEKLDYRSFSDNEKAVMNGFFSKVNIQYKKVVELAEKTETVAATSTSECPHIVVEEKLNRAYDLLEQDPDNTGLQAELNELLQEKQECTIESKSAILCKHCNMQLEVIISAEPSSFDDAQDIIMQQQQELIFNVMDQYEEQANDFNTKATNKYLDLYLRVLKIDTVKEVSQFNDDIAISNDQVADIKLQIIRLINNNDRIIFNNARSFFTKRSRVSADSMKSQLIHDIIKFLVIFFLAKEVDVLLLTKPEDFQAMFHKVMSFQVFVDKSRLNKEVRLNYTIRVYNLAIDIMRTAHNMTFKKDVTTITEETLTNLDEGKFLIVSQEFNLKQKNVAELKKEIMRTGTSEIELPIDLVPFSKELMKSFEVSYQKILERLEPTVFKPYKTKDLMDILEPYILMSEKKENIRMKLKQNNLNVAEIKHDINTLSNKIKDSSIPSEKLILEQRRDGLVQILAKNEQDKKELEGKTKQLKDDQEVIDQIEALVNSAILPTEGTNIVNLYQYVVYHNRSENRNGTNPHITEYNNFHDKLQIYEKLTKKFKNLDHRLLLKYIRGIFTNRYSLLEAAKEDIEFLQQLQDLSKVLDPKGTLSSIIPAISTRKYFIYESKYGIIRLEYSFIHHMRRNLNLRSLDLSYNALSTLLASTVFIEFVKTINTFDIQYAAKIVSDELNSYTNTNNFFKGTKQIVYLCPVCKMGDTNNINIKIHLASHHISTNDNLKTINPLDYVPEMKLILDKSKQDKGRVCPYCPYRGLDSEIFQHIREHHMNLKHSNELFLQAETRRYHAHLEKLYNDNKSVFDPALEAGTIHYDENKELLAAAKDLDNLDDRSKYYVLFCDQNVDTITTMRHVYNKGICVYCQRSVARVHQDASQGSKKYVINLVKIVEKRLKELNQRYCLLNSVSQIRMNPCKLKKQMVANMLDGKDTVLLNKLLPSDVSWELKKELDHVPFRAAKHLTDIVEQYKYLVRYDYAGSVPFSMVSLDDIDQIHALKQNKPSGYYRQYDKNYLNYISAPYRILTKDARDRIFFHPSVVNIDKEIRKLSENQTGDPIEYNKKIGAKIDELRMQIFLQTNEYLRDYVGSTSFTALAQDLTTVLGRTDSDAYADILKNMNNQHLSVIASDDAIQDILKIMKTNRLMNDSFIEDSARKLKNTSGNALSAEDRERRNIIRQNTQMRYIESLLSLPKELLFQLQLLSSGESKSYRRHHYVISQEKKK